MSERRETFEYTETEVLENLTEAKNYNNALLKLAYDATSLTPDIKILDFGAGLGTFADLFREKGLVIDCLEIDEREAEILKEKGYNVYRDVSEVPRASYEFIYSYNVLEHVEDDAGAIRDLEGLLKPGGKLLVFVPAFQILFSNMDKAVGHFRRYRKSSLRRAASRTDLKILKLSYFDSVGFFAALVFKLLGSEQKDITKKKIILFDRVVFPINLISDPICKYFFGKNAYMICEKRS